MGRKVHPMGFRIGVIRDWQAKWYAEKHYGDFLYEDIQIRGAIKTKYAEAAISAVEIERQANKVSITIHTARPGIVIGRGGSRVDEMRLFLENLIGKRIQLNIREVPQPELDAQLVARTVAEQIERRVAYRRAMKQAIFRTTQAGAKGIKISCSGRLGGADIARRQTMHEGRVPLQTLRADVDYGFAEAHTSVSLIGVKVWIYKGDILPELVVKEVEEAPPAEIAEAPAEPVAAVVPEEAKAEEVPSAVAAAAPAEPAAEVSAKPKRKSAKAAAAVEPEAAPAEPAAEVSAKPKRKSAKPAKSSEVKEPSAETSSAEELEGKDAATEAS